MKPSVPETGTVIRLAEDKAIVLLSGGKSCRGCGAAAIGLCRAGSTNMFLTAGNRLGARPGDVVMVGITRAVQWKGYVLAYVLPVVSLLGGAVAGHIAGIRLNLPGLDVLSGLLSSALAVAFSLGRLRRLDANSSMEVKRICSEAIFTDSCRTDEEIAYGRIYGQG